MYGLLQNLVVLRRLHAQWLRGRAYQPHFAWPDALAAWLGGLVAITALGLISNWSHYPLVVAPFGASTVLMFGHPASPLSQPRNIVAGNTLGALISVLCVAEWGLAVWVMGLAVGLTIALGQLLRCLHPPAGAVALLGGAVGRQTRFRGRADLDGIAAAGGDGHAVQPLAPVRGALSTSLALRRTRSRPVRESSSGSRWRKRPATGQPPLQHRWSGLACNDPRDISTWRSSTAAPSASLPASP